MSLDETIIKQIKENTAHISSLSHPQYLTLVEHLSRYPEIICTVTEVTSGNPPRYQDVRVIFPKSVRKLKKHPIWQFERGKNTNYRFIVPPSEYKRFEDPIHFEEPGKISTRVVNFLHDTLLVYNYGDLLRRFADKYSECRNERLFTRFVTNGHRSAGKKTAEFLLKDLKEKRIWQYFI